MIPRAIELDLPLGVPAPFEEEVAGEERHRHLVTVPGVDEAAAARLARSFPTLAAVYSADEEQLADVVGAVAAARIRWFLDAPISSAALPGRRRRTAGRWHRAA